MRYILALSCLFSSFAYSQSKPLPYARNLYRDTTVRVDIRERLVQLALQNPTYEIADHGVNVANYSLRQAKSLPLGLFSAAGNINEFTIHTPKQKDAQGNEVAIPQYFPRYNFGVGIPFDIVSRAKNTTKIARENLYIAQATRNDKFRQIRAEVLTKYEDYLLSKQMVEFQSQITQNEYGTYKRTEKDYQDNLIKLDEVDKTYKNWVSEQIKSIALQRNLNVAKIDLERLIGVKIEDVEAGIK